MTKRFSVLASPMVLWLLSTSPAAAYIGPGTGLGALGSILSFLGVVFLLLVGFFWYPIKRVIAKFQKTTSSDGQPPTNKS